MNIDKIRSFLLYRRIKFIDNCGKNLSSKAIKELNTIAKQQDVYVRLEQSKKSENFVNMQIFKKRCEHVADFPEIALRENTGNQIFISWKEKICEHDVFNNKTFIKSVLKSILNIN